MVAPKHHQSTHGWDAFMGQTVTPKNAYYPVEPNVEMLFRNTWVN